MLTIKDLIFAYKEQAEPWRFSMTVAPGEIVAVTGSSGSGKSTLLDLIAGFLQPASGSVSVNQHDLTTLPPEQRPVSILFQDDNLFDHLTASANIALGLPRRTAHHDVQQKVARALHEMDLGDLAERKASALSGGQKQRVALARTLLRNRPVLLLDEPFAGLDRETAAIIRGSVREIVRRQNWHTIIVSHLAEDAEGFADRRLNLTGTGLKPD
jgi:thiamine transport system ATP-binding protein